MMPEGKTTKRIVVTDDDSEDRFIMQMAFSELGIANPVVYLQDGVELMYYLHNPQPVLPSLILLDLNMPRMDGKQALKQIKSHSVFCSIPVLVLTTSATQKDVDECYSLGANGYLVKPHEYSALLELLRSIQYFWLDMAKLPR